MIAVVMTPATFGPMVKGRMIACLLIAMAHFCATLAVVGTQETPAMPISGLNFHSSDG